MIIKSLAVDNFRGITGGTENNKISFDNKNAIFLFGQNNVGKSSFLRAYKVFYDDAISDSDFHFEGSKDIVIEIELQIDEATEKEGVNQATSNKFDHIKENYLGPNGVLRLKKTWKHEDRGKKSQNETWNVKTEAWEQKAYAGIGWGNVFQPLMMRPLFINAMPTEQDVQTVVTEVLKEVAHSKLTKEKGAILDGALSTISRLQDEIYSKTDIDAYKADVNERFELLFPGFKIDVDDGASRLKFTPDKIGKDFRVSFKDDADNNNSHEQMGHGAVRMAIFLLMLMRDKLRGQTVAPKSFIVLFEEPELFLHPLLTKKLRALTYEVSADNMPFQVLCASHSPQMIDISKDHTSLVRMTKDEDGNTHLYQVAREDLKNDEQKTNEDIKQKIYEILRFDPFICEAFYADEVLLVEGDTEAILARGYQQEHPGHRDVFVVNCHSVVNIPFYQKIFSKFNIPYSVICDTDHVTKSTGWDEKTEEPSFTSHVQKTIGDLYIQHKVDGFAKKFFVFAENFEKCHQRLSGNFRFDTSNASEGKPYMADRYWKQIRQHNTDPGYNQIPVIKYFEAIFDKPITAESDTAEGTES
jgi:predicted ATP-dependent endonuclease of OLD family